MAEVVGELVKVLPDNEWLRFALIVIIVLLIILREKLFLGLLSGIRYLYRWGRCQVFRKHTWFRGAGLLEDNMVTGHFVFRCHICGKTTAGPGTL